MTLILLVPAIHSTETFPSKPQGYVTDQANVIEPATREKLESFLGRFESASSVQVAVVIVPSLDGRDINETATDLFKRWGIGRKEKDNGVLFLIAPNERKMRIEVGYGLEGVLPDGLAGRILDEAVVPCFRAGDINGGVLAGTAVICRTIAEKSNIDISGISGLSATERPVSRHRGNPFAGILVVVVLVIIFGRNPWLLWFILANAGRGGGGYGGGGGFGGGGFGGFGGGSSGGGGASRGW